MASVVHPYHLTKEDADGVPHLVQGFKIKFGLFVFEVTLCSGEVVSFPVEVVLTHRHICDYTPLTKEEQADAFVELTKLASQLWADIHMEVCNG